MFFQQMKRVHERFFKRQTNGEENFFLGAVAAAASVCGQKIISTVLQRGDDFLILNLIFCFSYDPDGYCENKIGGSGEIRKVY